MSRDAPVPPDAVFLPLPILGTGSLVVEDGQTTASASLANDPRPVAPVEPDAGDCCGEGCVRCVYDVYDVRVERYKAALEQWNVRHP